MTVPPISADAVSKAVAEALREDVGDGELTAELIPPMFVAQARVSAGKLHTRVRWFAEVSRQLDSNVAAVALSDVRPWRRTSLAAAGSARALLTGERTALNFLQTLSATATAARRYVDAVAGTGATILDTRKTIPGLRDAQKYAVRCGGAQNHRRGLYDAILIKENHIAAAGGLRHAVDASRQRAPSVMLEVEVESLGELREALACGVDRILLDNFSLEEIRQAVKVRGASDGPRVALEASGSIDLDGVRETALTGVDYISVGALTKHVQAADFSMRIV